MLCLDVTPEVVDEAVSEGCNLIVSHHPLLFHGLKQISPDRPNQLALLRAITHGIYIYSSHTALDNAPEGVSHQLGKMLGLMDIQVLSPRQTDPSTGLGVIGDFHYALSEDDFLKRVKEVYQTESLRVSDSGRSWRGVQNVALCSGSGGEFIPRCNSRQSRRLHHLRHPLSRLCRFRTRHPDSRYRPFRKRNLH